MVLERVPRALLFLSAVVLAAAVPNLGFGKVWEGIALQIVINASGALGLTLLFGFAGQISLAQATFVGAGAYATGIISTKYGWSPWLGLPSGIAVSMLLAAIVGYPVLRLAGLYLAMATAALNIGLIVIVIENASFTGGSNGLAGLEPLNFFGKSLVEPRDIYYLALAGFVILFLLAYRLTRSPIGAMLAALRHDQRAAGLAGIPVPMLKTKIFVLSAAFAAAAGFFLAEYLLYVPTESFAIFPSLYFLIMVVVGGVRSLTGAVIGAAFITVLPQLFPEHARAQQFTFAIAFLLITMFVPNGIVGVFTAAWSKVCDVWRNVDGGLGPAEADQAGDSLS
jgi:branched-chain amino acid transport system permease protein